MDYTDFISNALREASALALAYFGKVSEKEKPEDSNQIFTQADLAIGKFLIQQVETAYPSFNIIDEESGVIDKKSNQTWVIDPIDGTSNFVAGTPLYGVMIGLLEDDVPVAGGIALPAFSEIYIAEKGKGTFCNGEKVSVTREQALRSVLVGYGIDPYPENPIITREESALLAEIILNVRNIRASSSCFDSVMVARGSYGVYLNRSSKVWDVVAPQIICEEAGAIYTDFFGRPMNYSNILKRTKENFTSCIAPRTLHKQIQSIIHSNRKGSSSYKI